MSANSVLVEKDVNAAAQVQSAGAKPDIKSMEYHRQVLQGKLAGGEAQQSYVSPSDNIMSPCTQKLSAYRSKTIMKAKPKSLFAKASAKNMSAAGGTDMFGELKKTSEQS